MATLLITEYGNVATDLANQLMPVAQEPAIKFQKITFTTATTCAAFDKSTRYVRLIADADCHVAFGGSPTATSTVGRIAANTVEWRGIKGNGTEKLSVYDGAS